MSKLRAEHPKAARSSTRSRSPHPKTGPETLPPHWAPNSGGFHPGRKPPQCLRGRFAAVPLPSSAAIPRSPPSPGAKSQWAVSGLIIRSPLRIKITSRTGWGVRLPTRKDPVRAEVGAAWGDKTGSEGRTGITFPSTESSKASSIGFSRVCALNPCTRTPTPTKATDNTRDPLPLKALFSNGPPAKKEATA